MAAINRTGSNETKQTEQSVLNTSYDREFGVVAFENLVFDPTTNTLNRQTVGDSLVPSSYDYISLSYTDGNLTGAVFKTGGSGGTTVSTLALVYDGSNQLTSVTKT